jgi:hypothetical protein
MLRGMQRRTIIILASVLVVVGLSLAGIGWVVWSLIDQVGAPGVPGVTGSGACGSADAVNVQLTYADGRTVQACTRDRPACPNLTISGSMNGQSLPSRSEFNVSNQLRSSSGRYILFIRFDSGLAAEAAEQTITLNPGSRFMPGEPAPAALTSAIVGITPRDSTGESFTAQSGSLTVASTHGVAQGRIVGSFSSGPTRSDRPAPSSSTPSPVSISGTFACNR